MDNDLLTFQQVTLSYQNPVVHNLSFHLNPGEVLALVGESGCGKTSVLKSILGMPDFGVSVTGGEIIYNGKNLAELEHSKRQKLYGSEIAMVFQEPGTAFNPIRSYKKQFAEMLKSHGKFDEATSFNQILECFSKLHLPDGKKILESCPYEMSGGMNQRIAIAAALMLSPRLLLADEPTSALDVTAQKLVIEEMINLKELTGMSIIIVTHNLAAAAKIADKTGVIHHGRLVEYGLTQNVLENPSHPYTKQLITAVPALSHTVSLAQPASDSTAHSEQNVLLEACHITKQYTRKERTVEAVSDVSLRLKQGEILGIVGESGSGKSTLLRQISCLEKADDGKIFLEKTDITGGKTRHICDKVQMIFQSSVTSFDSRIKIGKSIDETLKNLSGLSKNQILSRRRELIQMVGLNTELEERYPSQLSGGQCQRMAIARALAANPKILLCDEITSALDTSAQAQIIHLLNTLRKEMQLSILFVSHDLALAGNFCDRLMVMQDGKCIEEGLSENVLHHPKEVYTKYLLSSILSLEKDSKPGVGVHH